MKKQFLLGLVLGLFIILIGMMINFGIPASVSEVQAAEQARETAPQATRSEPLIIDHTTTDITAVPQFWIEEAKNNLNIYYGHTSHGSQLVSGMSGLVSFANGGGLGLSLPTDIFAGLPMHEASPDAGYYPEWVNNTRSYLGDPDPLTGRGDNHSEINVVIWSWCGQVSSISEQDMLDHYLLPMTQLENDYPGITFVYMTGHSDGTGETGNLHLRNQQIRQYAIDNNKVLYDFYDIELYDPDGNYYGDKDANDDCDYDSDGNGSLDANWCLEWQDAHTEGVDWYTVSCAHSRSLNCNQKAYAAWWLWTSVAGWNQPAAGPDLSASTKTPSQPSVVLSDTLTYTIRIVNDGDPLTTTLQLTDTIPTGLVYVTGTLTATSGTVDDSGAPTLTWTGVLTPTPEVTLTYAVSVTVDTPQALTNTAVITVPGYEPITRSATIIANGEQLYLPLIVR